MTMAFAGVENVAYEDALQGVANQKPDMETIGLIKSVQPAYLLNIV